MLDNNYDVSILIDTNEKDEKNGEEKDTDFEIEEYLKNTVLPSDHNSNVVELLSDYSNNYNYLFKELTSPPPEFLF